MWKAVADRDNQMDGLFYYGVTSTGVYCRPSCHSRQPNRENVVFFKQRDSAEGAGFRPCKKCRPQSDDRSDPRTDLIEDACRYLEGHLDENVTLAKLGLEVGLSPFHLQRTFKAMTGVSPRAYADALRLQRFKTGLKGADTVTAAMYDAGYGSSSRLYERTGPQLGMTPEAYRKNGQGATISYSVVESPVGKLLVAATEKGICSVQLGDSAESLTQALHEEYQSAILIKVPASDYCQTLLGELKGHPSTEPLPLDIKATAFQRRVCEHLKTIPYGQTESYSEVAKAIGRLTAHRAVARACGSNKVALAIPCHRVIREDGSLGGYRWGIDRKKSILAKESELRKR
jgi:AraC family transcriptional regulator of adaptative response/methylated-DNA-[protein]-cysteine methyltransferase